MTQNLDPRWRIWAEALVNENCTLALRKWAGKGKLFRRLEYEIGMKSLAAMGFISFRGERFGYRPRRGRGWQYIIYMARGMVGLPPPLLVTTAPKFGSAVKRAGQPKHSEMHSKITVKSTDLEQK